MNALALRENECDFSLHELSYGERVDCGSDFFRSCCVFNSHLHVRARWVEAVAAHVCVLGFVFSSAPTTQRAEDLEQNALKIIMKVSC